MPSHPAVDDRVAPGPAGATVAPWSRPGEAQRGGGLPLGLHPLGIVVGTLFAALAMTPSLLPRTWLFQGVVSGVSGAAGYGVGLALAWLAHRSTRWRQLSDQVQTRLPRRARTASSLALLLAALVALAVMLVAAAAWQRQVAALMGIEQTTTTGWLRAGPLLLVVAAMLVGLARALRWLTRRVADVLHHRLRLPRLLASLAGAALVAFLVVTMLTDVLLRQALSVADAAFAGVNRETPAGVEQPQQVTRSGSPASLVPWDTLGKEGRIFVAGGRPGEQLAAAAGRAPLDPIRAYVGLASARGAQERADLAVAELERAGAFDRSVLAVVTSTGTGWVDPVAPESLELMYGGDTAVVATQYSYLPSWLSFLADRSRAAEAGRLLFDTVHARLAELPEDRRPRLLVFGESLGSQGSEAAFTSLADLRAQADGVLWVGPPNSNRVWGALVARRDPGTFEVEPVYASGLVVRFAGDPDDLTRLPTPWAAPRVLYLQNPSDPIVWWSPGLLLRRPDWLVEPRGDDVSPAMSWYPVVTFWQVSADLVNSQSVPDGHGHNYVGLIVGGWAAVAAPPGWTEADTARVRAVLDMPTP